MHKRLALLARAQDRSVGSLVRIAVARMLAEHDAAQATTASANDDARGAARSGAPPPPCGCAAAAAVG